MFYDYEPLTEEEAMKERFHLLDEGIYDATIFHAEARISKTSQNPMAEIILNVYDREGKIHSVKDYIVFTRTMAWKMKHLCDSAGLSKEYKEKRFHTDMAKNRNVKVQIKIQAGNEIPADKLGNKAPGAKYPDKNVVDDYIVTDVESNKFIPDNLSHGTFINDEVPF